MSYVLIHSVNPLGKNAPARLNNWYYQPIDYY
jgi:hypothetical protein